MSDFEWPETLRISAYLGTFAGRGGWAVVSGDHVLASGAVSNGADHVEAQMGVLEVLLKHPTLAAMPVDLATNDRDLRSLLASNRSLVPNIEPLPACRVSVCDPSLAFAATIASTAASKAGSVPVVAATDGARERHTALGGFGWVTEAGIYGHGFIRPTSPVEAELVAIADLLEHTSAEQPLLVLVDSAHARRLARAALRGQSFDASEPNAVNTVLARVGEHAHRDVTLKVVLGHSGDPLNEGAHRLAVLSRRGVRMGLDKDRVAEIAVRIAEETRELLLAAA